MAHDTGEPGDTSSTEDEYVDVDEELEPDTGEKQGFLSNTRKRLGNAKDKVVGFYSADEQHQSVTGQDSGISRRGVLTTTAAGLAGFGIVEATDGDGWDVDWNENGGAAGEGAAPGGVTPPPGNETETTTEGGLGKSQQYAFETEQELIDNTGLCYPGESDAYIGAVDANEVEQALDESGYMGNDPSGALNAEEVSMGLDDITPNQGLYAVDVDRKQGNDGDYDVFVQLVGQEDGGTYLTREGAQKVSNMEFEETFEGYQDCN